MIEYSLIPILQILRGLPTMVVGTEMEVQVHSPLIKSPILKQGIMQILLVYLLEAVGVVFVSGVLIDIFALFWRPSRKAIGLLNIILGILLMLSIIGFPFGIFLLLFGAILMFI